MRLCSMFLLLFERSEVPTHHLLLKFSFRVEFFVSELTHVSRAEPLNFPQVQ
jgi:hypothetical protein